MCLTRIRTRSLSRRESSTWGRRSMLTIGACLGCLIIGISIGTAGNTGSTASPAPTATVTTTAPAAQPHPTQTPNRAAATGPATTIVANAPGVYVVGVDVRHGLWHTSGAIGSLTATGLPCQASTPATSSTTTSSSARTWSRSTLASRRSRSAARRRPGLAVQALQRSRHEFLHDLVGAAVYPLHASGGIDARDRVLDHVAVAAEDLNAPVDDLAFLVSGPVLGSDAVAASRSPARWHCMQ